MDGSIRYSSLNWLMLLSCLMLLSSVGNRNYRMVWKGVTSRTRGSEYNYMDIKMSTSAISVRIICCKRKVPDQLPANGSGVYASRAKSQETCRQTIQE